MKKIIVGGVVVLVLLAGFFVFNQENLEDNVCSKDVDCVLGVLCGCHTQDYIDKEIEKYSKQGIVIEPCSHPRGARCVCIEGECEMIVEKEENENLISNNSKIEGLENLLSYKTEGRDSDNPYIMKTFAVEVNTNLFEKEAFNFNLPGELNLILEKEKIVLCKDDSSIAEELCHEGEYTWWGSAREEENGETIFFIVSEEGVYGSISPDQIPSFSTDYSYTLTQGTLTIK